MRTLSLNISTPLSWPAWRRNGHTSSKVVKRCALSATAIARDSMSALDRARADAKADISWARTKGAAGVLRQPPFADDLADTAGQDILGSLDVYLQARRWEHPSETPARRFLSHILTYPLTLASGLKAAGLDRHNHLSVACVGARAESSLPASLWLETLIALPVVSHLNLNLLGPEVVIPDRLPTAPEASLGGKGPSSGVNLNLAGGRSVHISWMKAKLGAEVGPAESLSAGKPGGSSTENEAGGADVKNTPAQQAMEKAMETAVANADVYVLFNPGLGHPHLREGWEAAAERFLKSGKPMILTCHSAKDLDRDHRRLNVVGERCFGAGWTEGRGKKIVPMENAFRSLREAEDPLGKPGETGLISPNWGMFVVAAARRSDLMRE